MSIVFGMRHQVLTQSREQSPPCHGRGRSACKLCRRYHQPGPARPLCKEGWLKRLLLFASTFYVLLIYLQTDSPRRLGLSSSSRAMVPSLHSLSHSHSQSLSIQRQPEVTFVLVFGFPPEQYSSVASTFASADASPPERASDTTNWFKIGYRSTWDAQRALRRNGEVVDGLFMIGVVAVVRSLRPVALLPSTDLAAQDAEMDVSAPVPRPASGDLASPGLGRSQTFTTFGTPIALAPSHSAFRPPSAAPSGGAKPASTSPVFAAPETGQSGGWTSKISDAIFGW